MPAQQPMTAKEKLAARKAERDAASAKAAAVLPIGTSQPIASTTPAAVPRGVDAGAGTAAASSSPKTTVTLGDDFDDFFVQDSTAAKANGVTASGRSPGAPTSAGAAAGAAEAPAEDLFDFMAELDDL